MKTKGLKQTDVDAKVKSEKPPQEKEGEKRGSGYVCSVCNETPVDPLNGFDTCDECAAKL